MTQGVLEHPGDLLVIDRALRAAVNRVVVEHQVDRAATHLRRAHHQPGVEVDVGVAQERLAHAQAAAGVLTRQRLGARGILQRRPGLQHGLQLGADCRPRGTRGGAHVGDSHPPPSAR